MLIFFYICYQHLKKKKISLFQTKTTYLAYPLRTSLQHLPMMTIGEDAEIFLKEKYLGMSNTVFIVLFFLIAGSRLREDPKKGRHLIRRRCTTLTHPSGELMMLQDSL